MNILTDFHSHILPGIDDGSRHVEQSLAMLQMEAAQGISQVVATPHFYPGSDRLERFLERRKGAENVLREAMGHREDLPELHIGAEVHYFPNISDCDELSQMTIDGSTYILIEMPHGPWSEEMWKQLENIRIKQGLTPIVAHVDRYIGRFRTHGIPERLEHMPVLVQANAEFLIKKSTANMALSLLRTERIHLLGSDCHDLVSRKPNLNAAAEVIEKRMGADVIARINRHGQRILGASDRT